MAVLLFGSLSRWSDGIVVLRLRADAMPLEMMKRLEQQQARAEAQETRRVHRVSQMMWKESPFSHLNSGYWILPLGRLRT